MQILLIGRVLSGLAPHSITNRAKVLEKFGREEEIIDSGALLQGWEIVLRVTWKLAGKPVVIAINQAIRAASREPPFTVTWS